MHHKKVWAVILGVAALAGATRAVGPLGAGADESTPNASGGGTAVKAGTTVILPETFGDADEILVYDVTVTGTHPDTRLKVSTMDCCIAGDEWGIQLIQTGYAPQEGTPPSGCGNGSTTGFSGGRNTPIGATTKTVRVILSYCRGVDIFPAGMSIRFIGTNNAPVVSPVLVAHYT
jgi:hypothetical protein